MKKLAISLISIALIGSSFAQTYEWAKSLGSTNYDYGEGIVTDDSGNVYITGFFVDTIDFDPGIDTADLIGDGTFFAKYDYNGNYLWAKSISYSYSYSIAIDGSGNIYITGNFYATTDFDPGADTANLTASGSNSIFFAKYDNNGNYLWARSIGSTAGDIGNNITTDALGNVYITGYFSDTSDFDPGPDTSNLASVGQNDIFFAKYDSSGNYVWARSIGSNYLEEEGYSIVIDSLGNVYLTGTFRDTADFDPGVDTANLISAGFTDIFIAKYDSNGNYLWANGIGASLYDGGFGITIDAWNNVYITGFFNGTADFDPGPGISNLSSVMSSTDGFFAKYDSNGNYLWAKSIGGTSSDWGKSITIDALANFYITGTFGSTADFDPGTGTANLTSVNSNDIFFAKYDSSGSYLWAQGIGSTSYDRGKSISIDTSGYVYITGYFSGLADFDPGLDTANLTSVGQSDIFFAKYGPPPLCGSWTQKAYFGGTARSHATGFSIGSKGYMGLGSDGTYKNDFWEYDPSSNTWTQKANFIGSVRSQAKAFAIGNKGYVGLGTDGTYKNDFYEYDPISNSWTQKANFGGVAREYAVGFSIGDRGYMGTGWNGSYLTDFWEYDTTLNNWTQKADFGGTARYGAVGFSIGNKGYIGTGKDGGLTNDFWEYDTTSNSWTQKANYAGGARAHGVGFSINSKGYIGTGESPFTNEFWQYDTTSNTWTQKADFGGTARTISAGFSMNGKGYIGTGSDGSNTNDFWEYSLVLTTSVSTLICDNDSIFLEGTYQNAPGTYYDTLIALNSCDSVVITTLSVNPAYSVSNSAIFICNGDSSLIYGTYRTTAGTYYDSLTTVNGCDSIHSIVLNLDTIYTFNDPDIVISVGDSVIIYGIYRSISGTYYDSLTTSSGCDSVHSTLVKVIPEISMITPTNATCTGYCDGTATASVFGGTQPLTFLWDDPLAQTTIMADSLCADTFNLIVVDFFGYSDTASVVVTEPLILISAITSSSDVTCFGDCDGTASVIAVNGVPPYSYLWTNGATSANATGLCSGNNSVVITDLSGCTDTNGVITSSPTQISVFPDSVINASCNGNCDGAIYLNITGGSSPYSYNWIPGVSTGPIATNLCVGSYTAIVQDFNGCTESNVFVVNEPLLLVASGFTTPTNCGDSSGTAQVSAIGGTFPYAYLWNDINAQTTDTATGLVAGSYQVTVTDNNGCIIIIPFSVVNLYAPVFIDSIKSTDVVCYGDASGTVTVAAGNGASPYAYSWNDPSAQTNSSATGLFAGTYTVLVTDTNGCTVNGNVQITEPPLISDSVSLAICSGDSAYLQGAYQNLGGNYTDTLVSANGCDSIISTTLTIDSTYFVIMPGLSICFGDSILIFGIYRKVAATYYDSLSTTNACDSVISTTLNVDLSPSIGFTGLDSNYCIGDVLFTDTLVGSPSGGTFNGPGMTGNIFDPFSTGFGTFTITYSFTDGNGCTDSVSQDVSVTNCTGLESFESIYDLEIYPNPNTGVFNIAMNITQTESFELKIFNNLGQEILKEKLTQFKGIYEKQLDFKEHPAGVYNLQLVTDKGVVTRQIIIE